MYDAHMSIIRAPIAIRKPQREALTVIDMVRNKRDVGNPGARNHNWCATHVLGDDAQETPRNEQYTQKWGSTFSQMFASQARWR